MLEKIKADKTRTMKFWRIRLLHWAFSEDAKRPQDSSLPIFLYTKECPLFWLTNGIVLISPLILYCKVFGACAVVIYRILNKYVFKPAVVVCGMMGDAIVNKWNDWLAKANKKVEAAEEVVKADKTVVRKLLKKILIYDLNKQDVDSKSMLDFKQYWHTHAHRYAGDLRGTAYTHEEMLVELEDMHGKIAPIMIRAKKARLEKKAARDARILQFVHISQVVCKVVVNVLWVGLFGTAAWVTFAFGIPTITWIGSTVAMMWNWFDSGSILDFIGWITLWGLKIGGAATMLFGVVYGLFKMKIVNTVYDTTAKAVSPFGSAFVGVCGYIKRAAEDFLDFCSIFYSNNCPNVTIVEIDSDEEAIEEEIGE